MANAFHTPRVLTENDLQRIAPSIFAEAPYPGMSSKYSFIPTIEVLRPLMDKGWLPVKATEARTRNEEKAGYTKHMIRLRRSDAPIMVGDVIPELCIINAHDGGAAYQALAGLFRLACSNGLMVDEGTIERISIRHTGDVIGEVGYAAKWIAKELPKVQGHIKKMQSIELTPDQRGVFAAAALDLRYDHDEKGRSLAPIDPGQLLRVRRMDDNKSDLWTTFNTVQENLLQGGLRGRSNGETRRRVTTRQVKGVAEDVRLNRSLWTLAREMEKLAGKRRTA
jgi:hypothetical protein